MRNHEEVSGWLLRTVQLIVDCPDEVLIRALPDQAGVSFLIGVHPGDLGRVIGRHGRTAQSLRVLANAMGMKMNLRFVIDVQANRLVS